MNGMLVCGGSLLFGALFLCVYWGGRLTPGVFLALTWGSVYAVQGFVASDMYFSAQAGLIAIALICAFALGEWIGIGGSASVSLGSIASPVTGQQAPEYLRRPLSIAILILGFGGVALAFRYYLFVRGVANASGESLLIAGARDALFQEEVAVPASVRFAVILAYPGVLLAIVYWTFLGWRWFLALPGAGVVLFGFSQAGRAGVALVLLQYYVALYFRDLLFPRRGTLGRLGMRTTILLGVAAGVFAGGQLLREGKFDGVADLGRIFNDLRGYALGGVSTFAYYVDHWMPDAKLTLGRYTFSSLFDVLGLFPQATGVYDHYAPISSIGETSNVFTAFRQLIDDFGFIGAASFCVAFGFMSGRSFLRSLRGDAAFVGLTVALYSWVLFSPVASVTQFNSFLASLLLPWMFVRFVRARHRDRGTAILARGTRAAVDA